MMALPMRSLLLSLSILGALASVGCAEETKTSPSSKSDELELWKNPDGSVSTSPPHPIGSEVGVGLPGLVCSSFSELALAAETQCRRQGLALIALKPDGFCSQNVYFDYAAGGTPGYAGGGAPMEPAPDQKPIPEPQPTDPVPPMPGPGPIPGPIPQYWGFDHAIGLCGHGPVPPPPYPCNEKECPPAPCDERFGCVPPEPPLPCNEKECPPTYPTECKPNQPCPREGEPIPAADTK